MRRTPRFSLLISLLLVSLLWSSPTTAAAPQDPEAELTLATAQDLDLAGRSIRCRAARDGRRTVGIHVTAARVRFTNASIDSCDIGLLVEPAASAIVTNVTITRGTVGIWDKSTGTLAEANLIGDVDVGVVLSGHSSTYRRNSIVGTRLDGLLLLGDRNLLEANRIERSAGIGLYAAAQVPLRTDWQDIQEVLWLKDAATGNTIRNNVLVDNGVDLADQTEPCRAFRLPDGTIVIETQNTWDGNTYASKWPDCLQ